MHCSRETLAAYLEGDLGRVHSFRVSEHLKRCLHCSRSLAASEHERQRLSLDFPGPDWNSAFQSRLNQELRVVESRLSADRDCRWFWSSLSVTACCLAALAGAVLLWRAPATGQSPPAANEVIARASTVENEWFRSGSIRQDLTIEIEQIRPRRDKRRSRLEAWSDNQTGRFAARWVSEDGTLKHAQWKPSDGSEIVYAPARSPVTIRNVSQEHPVTSLASIAEAAPDVSQVESNFMQWMESRSWRPISFAADLSIWTHQDGTVMHVEQIESEQGIPRIRIIAQRRNSRMVAVLTLEVDAQTYSPRLQTVRIEEAGREVEFRLALAGTRRILSSELTEALFRPPASVRVQPSRPIPSTLPEPSPQVPVLLPVEFNAAPVLAVKVRVLYALHMSGACAGHPVEIAETPHGVMVRGRGGVAPGSESTTVDAPLREVLSALADLRTTPLAAQPPNLPKGDLPRFAELNRHLGALENLIHLLNSDELTGADVYSLRLVRTMVDDHDRFIRSQLASLNGRGDWFQSFEGRRLLSLSLFRSFNELHRKSHAVSESQH